MRPFSSAAYESLVTNLTAEIWLVLCEMKIGTQTFFLCANSDATVTSNGQDYAPYPFDVRLPVESIESIETVQITIDNVDLSYVAALRAANDPLEFTLRFVLASQPDTIELELTDLISDQVQFDAQTISATLTVNDVLNQVYPGRGGTYDPAQCPALF